MNKGRQDEEGNECVKIFDENRYFLNKEKQNK